MSEEAADAMLFSGRSAPTPTGIVLTVSSRGLALHSSSCTRSSSSAARSGVTGLTGIGKTYLACSLARAACSSGQGRAASACPISRASSGCRPRGSGGEHKLVRKYDVFGLLVVDEWLLGKSDA